MSKTFCTFFNQNTCRSCEWLEDSVDVQIQKKERALSEALSYWGTLPLEKTMTSPLQGFRNRAKWIVTGTIENPIIGLTGIDDLDQGRDLVGCSILHSRINELTRALPALITQYSIAPYKIVERKGELKALIIFYSPHSQQMYLRFILRSKESVLRLKKMCPQLQEEFKDLVCISANIQPIPQAILEGPEEIYISKESFIRHTLKTKQGDISLKLSPQAFVQTNTLCANTLYQNAAEWISTLNSNRMLELYCGQGAFSFFAAPYVKQILGIEINDDAIKTAQECSKELDYKNLSFLAANAENIESEMNAFDPDLILVNPPRRGLGNSVQHILKSLPKNFIYSSCSVESLSEDLKVLKDHYNLKKIQIFDMFPHTKHFEILTHLELK